MSAQLTQTKLGRRIDLVQSLHASTKRDYVGRVTADKAACAAVASHYDAEYWDGDRKFGYGGYRYDGRWRPLAEKLAEFYGLRSGNRVLDVGCGKGYLLYELAQVVPGLQLTGIDVSSYAVANAKPEVQAQLRVGDAAALPFGDGSFDFVISLGTLHNLGAKDLWSALREVTRVGRGPAYVMVESYRNQEEKANFLAWQLTCRSFYSVEDWEFVYGVTGYGGDYGFIFFT